MDVTLSNDGWSVAQTRPEDRRLIAVFGEGARRYIARVPAYLPRIPRTRAQASRSRADA